MKLKGQLLTAHASLVLADGATGQTTITSAGTAARVITLPDATDTLVGKATTDTLTNKTLTSPVLTTPTLGAATATSINKVTITAPAAGATLTIADGKTLTASNTLTFTGTDSSTVAFGAGGTVAYTSNKLSAFAATTSAELAGVISDETGSGKLVFDTSPTLVTPTLGVATATSVNGMFLVGSGSTLNINTGKTLQIANSLQTSSSDGAAVAFGTGGTVAYTSDKLSVFAPTTSSELAGVISDETGSGKMVFGTSPTLVTPLIDDYLELNEEAAPSTPASGKGRLYASTAGKLKFINDDGVTVEVGSSSGSGEKNYVTNPSGVTDVAAAVPTGWANVGDLDIVVTKTAAELPREYTTAAGFKITADANTQSTADYVYYDFTLDDVDLSKKLKISWSQKVTGTYTAGQLAVVITTQADRTTAVATPTVTAIPASDGVFTTYFDASTTATLSLVIRATGDMTTDGGIVISDVVVGPGIQPQGAVVGPWTTFTLTPKGTSSDPSKATSPTLDSARWRRVADTMEIEWNYQHSGSPAGAAAGSGAYYFTVPDSKTIDTSRYQANALVSGRAGDVSVYDGTNAYWGEAQVRNSTTILFGTVTNGPDTGAAGTDIGSTRGSMGGAAVRYALSVKVPIAEWAGSGTVNLAQNDVEFAYNTSTSTTAADTTSFGYGPGGAQIQSITAALQRTVSFQRPIQATDVIQIEVWSGSASDPWMPISGLVFGSTPVDFTFKNQNATQYGMGLRYTTGGSTAIVAFGQYATNTSTYGAGGTSWSGAGLNTYYWRVRKMSAGQAVGFGEVVPGTSSGLVSASGLKGRSDAGSVATGYVGEVQRSASSSSSNVTTSNTFQDMGSITLTAGEWDISLVAVYNLNGATCTYVEAGIGTTSGNSSAGMAYGDNEVGGVPPTAAAVTSLCVPSYRVAISSTTTYYAKAYATFSAGNPQFRYRISARRVA